MIAGPSGRRRLAAKGRSSAVDRLARARSTKAVRSRRSFAASARCPARIPSRYDDIGGAYRSPREPPRPGCAARSLARRLAGSLVRSSASTRHGRGARRSSSVGSLRVQSAGDRPSRRCRGSIGNVSRMDDVLWLDATAQADLVRSGQISAQELATAAIARIESVDGELTPSSTGVSTRRWPRSGRACPAGPSRECRFSSRTSSPTPPATRPITAIERCGTPAGEPRRTRG